MEKSKARIFHVEDDQMLRKIFGRFMEEVGHEVVLSVGTVAQALPLIPEELIRLHVNVALLDGRLPDGTGEQVAAKIRAHELPIPIMSLSAEDLQWGDVNFKKYDPEYPEQILGFMENRMREDA